MRQKYFLCHLFIQENDPILCICEWPKVCESLGLAVNLKGEIKVHLFRGVFSQCNDHQMLVRDLFYSKNGIYQSLIMFVEVNHVMNKGDLQKKSWCCSSGWKGYKTISKEFGLHKSTVRQIVYKWRKIQDHCYLPEKWSKVPRVTSKQLKAFLTLTNVNVHEPTIRRTLSNHGVHDRVCKKKATVLHWTIGERFNGWMKPK